MRDISRYIPYILLGVILLASVSTALIRITDNKIIYNTSPLTQFQYNSTSNTLEFTGNISFDKIKHYGETASYIIFKDGSTVYCKNGSDGHIEYSSTNASVVIQYAINHAGENEYIFIRRENYTVDASIILKDGIVLSGEGWSYVSEPSTVTGTILYFTGSGCIDCRDKRHITIRDIALVGDTTTKAIKTGSDGRSNNYLFENLLIVNHDYGVWSDTSKTGLYDSLFLNCNFYHNTVAVYIDENMNTFQRCTFRKNTNAIQLSGGYNIIFDSCVFSGNTYIIDTDGYNLGQIHFDGCWFEAGGATNETLFNWDGATNRFTKGITFDNSYLAKLVINLDGLYQTHRSKVILDKCWWQNLDETDISTYLPYLSDMQVYDTYRIDTGGAIYEIRFRNYGTATITASSTTVVVNHGLNMTPNYINVEPSGDIGYTWVSDVNSTSFTIHCSSAPTSDTTIYWTAKYEP